MPSTMTKLQVWNLAIDIIKDTALRSDGDGSQATARWLERNYAHVVRSTLRAYPWNFAKRQVAIPAETDAPPFGFSKAYKPPGGWLRVLPLYEGGNRNGRPIQHEIVGQLIHTNAGSPLKVTLIMDVSDSPGLWDDLFIEMVSARLALGMANKFTSKNKFIELASQMLANATQQAELIDTYEGTAPAVEQFDILRARGDDGWGGNGYYGRGTYHGGY